MPRAHRPLGGRRSRKTALRERLARIPRVHFVGYRSDVPEVVRAPDLLVLPSYAVGSPCVVLEVMAAGLPVVATAVSETPGTKSCFPARSARLAEEERWRDPRCRTGWSTG